MKKFVIIIDALKDVSDFKSSTFFKNYNQSSVFPPFSFKPEASFLTGKSPEETDSGTMYIMDKNYSKFKNLFITSFLPERPIILRKIVKAILIKFLRIVKKISKSEKIDIGYIPFSLLPNFSMSTDVNLFDCKSDFQYKTIFNTLNSKNKNYVYVGEPFSSGQLANVKKKISSSELLNNDTFFIYITDLDTVGHAYGGSSIEYFTQLKKTIQYLDEIALFLKKNNQDFEFLIFGDHGMADVKRTIDIEAKLKKTNLKINRDFVYFLDSTLARFWFKNNDVRRKVMRCIENDEHGSWITEYEKSKYQIRYKHNKFGDDIWWASGGTIISPNFWQGTNFIKGMHGYRDEVVENNTMVLYPKDKYVSNPTSMMGLNELIIDFLELN